MTIFIKQIKMQANIFSYTNTAICTKMKMFLKVNHRYIFSSTVLHSSKCPLTTEKRV